VTADGATSDPRIAWISCVLRGDRTLCHAPVMAKWQQRAIVERLALRVTGVDVRGVGVRGPTGLAPVAMGALAIGAVAIGRASIKRLTIEELEVTRLKVTELELAGEQRPPI
jgi:hypothetical protein